MNLIAFPVFSATKTCRPLLPQSPWSQVTETLLPACAGMIPYAIYNLYHQYAALRTRGDDPTTKNFAKELDGCPPHMRG